MGMMLLYLQYMQYLREVRYFICFHRFHPDLSKTSGFPKDYVYNR